MPESAIISSTPRMGTRPANMRRQPQRLIDIPPPHLANPPPASRVRNPQRGPESLKRPPKHAKPHKGSKNIKAKADLHKPSSAFKGAVRAGGRKL